MGKILWRRDRLPTPVFLGFPSGSVGKESTFNAGDLGGEDSLEKGKATHSSILAWRIPRRKESHTTEWEGELNMGQLAYSQLNMGQNK